MVAVLFDVFGMGLSVLGLIGLVVARRALARRGDAPDELGLPPPGYEPDAAELMVFGAPCLRERVERGPLPGMSVLINGFDH